MPARSLSRRKSSTNLRIARFHDNPPSNLQEFQSCCFGSCEERLSTADEGISATVRSMGATVVKYYHTARSIMLSTTTEYMFIQGSSPQKTRRSIQKCEG
ncbi:hypothetical protein CIHG_09372 [Coccidioides immitis H538.4]|uniref:Uncharacterized protein n=3 Tax=Coccidioides immitis TaxID=5501 RepID=A0A0J8R0Q3_COCIT|nr:hypothetical protein CIRG_02533 [Coccidioides immitis RMSCC 2394]KMU77228.1 hypothetical protein CISG_06071 [Coccidioides immitis RMSCC 3703]KMU91562.1 hypothetical protein CIHG_09372 [Coccidioides immitis H538.4]